jgi:ABC-type histidine transport system ATPase subunit
MGTPTLLLATYIATRDAHKLAAAAQYAPHQARIMPTARSRRTGLLSPIEILERLKNGQRCLNINHTSSMAAGQGQLDVADMDRLNKRRWRA